MPRIIELDAATWKIPLDFYDALLHGLGAPPQHGKSVDAVFDSIVWGGMNKIGPPYLIAIKNSQVLSSDILAEISMVRTAITDGRAEALQRTGQYVDVKLSEPTSD